MIRIRERRFAAGVVVAVLLLVSGCSSSNDERERSARRSDVDPTISTVASTSPPTLPPLPTAPLSVTVPPVVSTPPNSRGLLVANRRTWNLERPDRYTYTYTVLCECPPAVAGPFTATVEGETLVSSQVPPEATSGEVAPVVLTIDELFTLIDNSIDEMARVDVAYDPTLGYPTRILLGQDRVPSETDRTYEVTAFTPG